MIGLLFAAATVASLGTRPAEIAGPDRAAYETKLDQTARALAQEARGAPCPEAVLTSVRGFPLDDAALAKNRVSRAAPEQVVWSEHVRVGGCGAETVARFLIAKVPQGWGVIPLAPGTGVTGARLWKDALGPAIASALVQKPDLTCANDEKTRTTRLADTALTSAYVEGQPWTERWTFSVCGQDRPVDIDFTPASDGGTDYRMRAR